MAFGWIGLTNAFASHVRKANSSCAPTRGFFIEPRALPRRPDAGEEGERLLVVDREPAGRFLRLGVLVFAERRPRHDATVVDAGPTTPVWRIEIADIGEAVIRLAVCDRGWRCPM